MRIISQDREVDIQYDGVHLEADLCVNVDLEEPDKPFVLLAYPATQNYVIDFWILGFFETLGEAIDERDLIVSEYELGRKVFRVENYDEI